MVVLRSLAFIVGISIPVTDHSSGQHARTPPCRGTQCDRHRLTTGRSANGATYVLTVRTTNRIQLGRQDINAAGVVISTTQTTSSFSKAARRS
jgi:hypothetical protein